METSPPFDFSEQIEARVDALRREASQAGRPSDPAGLLADLETRLAESGPDGFDPPDRRYWGEVLAALRRRAGLPE